MRVVVQLLGGLEGGQDAVFLFVSHAFSPGCLSAWSNHWQGHCFGMFCGNVCTLIIVSMVSCKLSMRKVVLGPA